MTLQRLTQGDFLGSVECFVEAAHGLEGVAGTKQKAPARYACGPDFAHWHDYRWHYVIALKDDDLPSVSQKFAALAPLNPQPCLRLSTSPHAEIKQRLWWVNQIDYRDL